MPKRSHEPIFWSLFGAGGVLAALVLPALVLITGLAWPLGWLSEGALSYPRMSDFVGSALGSIAVFLVISLTLWHAAHRVYHSLHDLGVHRGLRLCKVACYGAALLGTLGTGMLLVGLVGP